MELSKDELICVGRHLVAQHRQNAFDETSNITEACANPVERCPLSEKCYTTPGVSKTELWSRTYVKICKAAGVKYSFLNGRYPMVPYEKEDNLKYLSRKWRYHMTKIVRLIKEYIEKNKSLVIADIVTAAIVSVITSVTVVILKIKFNLF